MSATPASITLPTTRSRWLNPASSEYELESASVMTLFGVTLAHYESAKSTTGNEMRVPNIAGVPCGLIDAYVARIPSHSAAQRLEDDVWFSTVMGLEGLWGEGDSLAEAEADLAESARGWVEVRLAAGLTVPPIDGIDPNPRRVSEAA